MFQGRQVYHGGKAMRKWAPALVENTRGMAYTLRRHIGLPALIAVVPLTVLHPWPYRTPGRAVNCPTCRLQHVGLRLIAWQLPQRSVDLWRPGNR